MISSGLATSEEAIFEPDVLEPLVEAQGEFTGLLHRPPPGRVPCDAAEVHPASAMLDEDQDYSLFSSTVSTCRKAGRQDPGGLGVQKLPPGWA